MDDWESEHFQRFHYISESRLHRHTGWHSSCVSVWFQMLVLCLCPCLHPHCCYPSLPLLSFFVFAIASFATLSNCRVHAIHARHTHIQSIAVSYLLQMTGRKQWEREQSTSAGWTWWDWQRGEDNLLCHLSLYCCLSYITPSLSLYLPAHLSLTHFHHLSFSVLPSFPPTLSLSIFSHCHAQLPPSFSFSYTFISPLTCFSLLVYPCSWCQAPFVSFGGFKFLSSPL